MNLEKLTAQQIEAAMKCNGTWFEGMFKFKYEDTENGRFEYSFWFGVEGRGIVYITEENNQLHADFGEY